MSLLIQVEEEIPRNPNYLIWQDSVAVTQFLTTRYVPLRLGTNLQLFAQGKVSTYMFKSDIIRADFTFDSIGTRAISSVAQYLFYEGSGNILHDLSGNGNDGTINNGTWGMLPNGKYYLHFDGSSTYVSLPTPLIPNPTAVIAEALFRVEKLNSFQIIYRQGCCGEHNIDISNTNNIEFAVKLSDQNWYVASSASASITAQTGQWYHAVGVWVRGKYVRLYLNGQKVAEVTVPDLPLYDPGSAFKCALGAFIVGTSASSYFGGDIACVRVFNDKILRIVPSIDDLVTCLYNLAKVMVPDLP